MIRQSFFIFIILICICDANSYERSDAFIIRLFDNRIKVLGPKKYDEKLNVIIENKTLLKSIARLERAGGKLIKYVSVMPGKFTAIKLVPKKGEVFYFVPLSPPFQKIELIPGRRPYEIPPKR